MTRDPSQERLLKSVIEQAGGGSAAPPRHTLELVELRGVNIQIIVSPDGAVHQLQLAYHDGRRVLTVNIPRLTAAQIRNQWTQDATRREAENGS